MNRMLRSPRNRLYALLAAFATLAIGGGIAHAELGGSDSGPKPPARPLAQAVLGALNAPKVDGITANVHVTNNLLPPGTLPKGASSVLASGADGRLWLNRADHRLRLELTTSTGRVELSCDGKRATLYDEGSNTLYNLPVPPPHDGDEDDGFRLGGGAMPLAALQSSLAALLRSWDLSDAKPTTTAGRPAYTLRISPKDDGGLLGAAEVTWDADHGVPLRAAIFAQGNADPVFEIAATKVSYGRVADADLKPTERPGARVVSLDPDRFAPDELTGHVHGPKEVQRHLDFKLAAPHELAGLPRHQVELLSFDGVAGAVSVYGSGLGTIAVLQYKAKHGQSHGLPDLNLPEVNIDGLTGKELATALGTVVTFERDGVAYVVAGLVPPVAAENAARGLS